MKRGNERDVAIVGMALRVPGAETLEAFWDHVVNGRDCLTRYSLEELKAAGAKRAVWEDPDFVASIPQLDNVKVFDPEFFGMSLFEAERTEPSQRLFLECSFEALEQAGIAPGRKDQKIAVFTGTEGEYLAHNLRHLGETGSLPIILGNDIDFSSARVSHKLDLTGPSMTVMAACATSLMAVHLAVASLRRGESDVAIAGGATVLQTDQAGYHLLDGDMLSASGRIRPFDDAADGTVFGSGAGVVVLKPLATALEEGLPIYGVIRGTAASNDGNPPGKKSFTAPSPEGQTQAIAAALADAGVHPETIGYIEAHGTGTRLGDPTELESLTSIYRQQTDKSGYCGLGSVKGNVGHLRTAAGVVSLIKTCLAMKHGTRPPVANFETINSRIHLADSPFFISTEASDWPKTDQPYRAGVSAFGFGGSNAHVVLEAAPDTQVDNNASLTDATLCVVSAKTEQSLTRRVADLAKYVDANPQTRLDDLAHTLATGRMAMKHRTVFYLRPDELQTGFRRASALPPVVSDGDKDVIFLFPGQGSQYVGMGQGLYQTAKVFRETLDLCAELLEPQIEVDIRSLIFSDDPDVLGDGGGTLRQTANAQPALFVIEYALARQLQHWGVQPAALLGHSVGELVAACLAGIFSLSDGLKIVATRSRLMQACDPGAMLVVVMPAEEVAAMLPENVEIAAVNAPGLTVVSGPVNAVQAFEDSLTEKAVGTRRLRTSHGFHSAMMEPALPAFRELLASIKLSEPSIPVISNITGLAITSEQACDPFYWADQIRSAVQFSAGARTLLDDAKPVFIELGPGRALSELINQHDPDTPVLTTLLNANEHAENDELKILQLALAKLWQYGANIDWASGDGNTPKPKLALPTYPFQKRLCWIEPNEDETLVKDAVHLYSRVWEPEALDAGQDTDEADRPWLIFDDQRGLADGIVSLLRTQGKSVFRVRPGNAFEIITSDTLSINPGSKHDCQQLFEHIVRNSPAEIARQAPRILHLWLFTGPEGEHNTLDAFATASSLGHNTLLAMIQAAHEVGVHDGLDILVAGDGLLQLNVAEDQVHAEKAGIIGPITSIPEELKYLGLRLLDISGADAVSAPAWLLDGLVAEASNPEQFSIALLRRNGRYIASFGKLPELPVSKARLRNGGVVLITGGVGSLGLLVANELFRQSQAKLILTTRWSIPPRDTWAEKAKHDDKIGRALAKVLELIAKGAQVLLVKADSMEFADLQRACHKGEEHFGEINGVIHAAGVSKSSLVLEEQPEIPDWLMGKVHGAFHLERLFADKALDIFIHFSSQASTIPNAGQSIYGGGNAVLDALAVHRNRRGLGFACAIGWGPWEQIGMAADFMDDNGKKTPQMPRLDDAFETVNHPLLQKKYVQSPELTVFSGLLHPGHQWLVDAHRLQGRAILAGVAHIECIRAAAANYFGTDNRVEILNLSLMRPLYVEEHGTQMELHITRESKRQFVEIRSYSPTSSSSANLWVANSTAEIRVLESPLGVDSNMPPIDIPEQPYLMSDSAYLDGGERWRCNVFTNVDGLETWARLQSADALADPEEYGIHPPILDSGIGSHGHKYNPESVPKGAEVIRVYGNTGLEVFVHGQSQADNPSITDLDFYNSQGQRIIEIRGFEMNRIEGSSLIGQSPQKDRPATLVEPAAGTSYRMQVAAIGDLDSITLEPYSLPMLNPDEVQIQIVAAGLNFRDVLTVLGKMPDAQGAELDIGGECSGYIEAVGANVTGLRVGDPVVAMASGCFASHVNVKADQLVVIPDNLMLEDLAGVPSVFLTADYALNKLARLQPGERVLIHAAAGGVGLAAVQIAKQIGAEIYATAGRQEKHDYLHSIGVEHVFNSRSLDFADDVRAATNGEGVDVVLNSLAGDFITAGLELLRPYGRFVEIGKRDIYADMKLGLLPFRNNLSYMALDLAKMTGEHYQGLAERFETLIKDMSEGTLEPIPTQLIDIKTASAGFIKMSRGEHIGKLVFKVGEHKDPWRAVAKAYKAHFGKGILVKDGIELIRRIMASDTAPVNILVLPHLLTGVNQSSSQSLQIDSGQRARPSLDTGYCAAETPTQEFLVDLWKKTVGISDLGIDDDFFDLGGDSIMAIQIQFAIYRKYEFRISSEAMIKYSTIRMLAEEIERQIND